VDGNAWLAGIIVNDMYLGGSKVTKAITVQEQESGYWLTA
jgi:hypothetical protein